MIVIAPRESRPGSTAGGIARRLGWGVGDQAVSSLSNFAMGVFVARSLGAAGFGAFALGYVTYAWSSTRPVGCPPTRCWSGTAERSHLPGAGRRRVATGTALVVGSIAGVVCIVVGVVLPRDP